MQYLGIEPSTTLSQLGILGLRRQRVRRVPSVRLSLCASSSAAVLLVDVTHGESSHFARAGERWKEGRKERRRVSECTCSAVPPFLTHPGSHSCVWPTKRYATETTRREGAAFSLTRVGNKSIKKGEILRKQCSGSTATEREEEAYSTPQQSSTLRAPSAVQTFPLFLFILSTSHVRPSVLSPFARPFMAWPQRWTPNRTAPRVSNMNMMHACSRSGGVLRLSALISSSTFFF